MTTQNQATAEQDGIIHGIAQACISALREAATAATTERFIALAVAQAEQVGEFSTERVAAHLHSTLKAISAISSELQEAGHEPK